MIHELYNLKSRKIDRLLNSFLFVFCMLVIMVTLVVLVIDFFKMTHFLSGNYEGLKEYAGLSLVIKLIIGGWILSFIGIIAYLNVIKSKDTYNLIQPIILFKTSIIQFFVRIQHSLIHQYNKHS